MLDPLVEPLLKIVGTSLEDIKSEKKDFYKSIGEGNEEGIIKVLEKVLETEEG